jgi:hypothetical protein
MTSALRPYVRAPCLKAFHNQTKVADVKVVDDQFGDCAMKPNEDAAAECFEIRFLEHAEWCQTSGRDNFIAQFLAML